jgi:hypothetical protein
MSLTWGDYYLLRNQIDYFNERMKYARRLSNYLELTSKIKNAELIHIPTLKHFIAELDRETENLRILHNLIMREVRIIESALVNESLFVSLAESAKEKMINFDVIQWSKNHLS